jgi:hypothetical protein
MPTDQDIHPSDLALLLRVLKQAIEEANPPPPRKLWQCASIGTGCGM